MTSRLAHRSRVNRFKHSVRFILDLLAEVVFIPLSVPFALLSRLARRRIQIGLGPEPLINNLYHARALRAYGYTAETFVNEVWHITSDFDDRSATRLRGVLSFLRPYYIFAKALWRYQALYFYFNGGPLMSARWSWRIEPLLLRIAGIRTVVMPYGADVQDLVTSSNLLFKHAMSVDYPMFCDRRRRVRRQVDLWTSRADVVLSGVEWVDYMYHWDVLMLGHFSIDTADWMPVPTRDRSGPLRILHAPNHRTIKGTDYFVRAIDELRSEGLDVELVMLQGVPNDKIKEMMESVDVVADQLVIGWYAMFAIEAMAMGKPVLCYLREDLIDFYVDAGLVERGEIPLINCRPGTIKATIRSLIEDDSILERAALAGPGFVQKHHSLQHVGGVFAGINTSLGISPVSPITIHEPLAAAERSARA